MSVENHARDPRGAGFFWGLLISLTAIAAMLAAAATLYIDFTS